MVRYLALLCLLPLAARADVTVVVSGCSDDTCTLTVSGDPVSVVVTLGNGAQFDQFSGASVPALGANNDSAFARAITVTPPVTGRFELDGSPQRFDGGTIAVGPATATFVQSGTIWTASVSSNPPPPAPPVTGRASMRWIAPTANEDGSTPVDLLGYRVQWGTVLGTWSGGDLIDSPTTTTWAGDMPCGPTYFAVAALSSDADNLSPVQRVTVCGPTNDAAVIEWPEDEPLPAVVPWPANTTVTLGVWDLYRGSTIASRNHATEAACVQAAASLAARTYTCRTRTTVVVRVP